MDVRNPLLEVSCGEYNHQTVKKDDVHNMNLQVMQF